MIEDASVQIKKQANERKLEQQRREEEQIEAKQSTGANGKRTIQPKKAFLLAVDCSSEETASDEEDERYPNETPEERKARKLAELEMDKMDGVL